MSTGDLANAVQRATWNGDDATHWIDHRNHLDDMSRKATERLFDEAGIGATDQVLDIGCGTGQCTRIAARSAAKGHAVGIDLSTPMVAAARSLAVAEQLSNVDFIDEDAQTHRFDAGRFDVAISRAGVMFFDDPHAAFANVRSSLKSGGRLVFVCHRDAPGPARDLVAAISAQLPASTSDAPPPIVDFTDEDQLHELCKASGFTRTVVEPIDYLSRWGTELDETVDFLFDYHLSFLTRALTDDNRNEARSKVIDMLRPFHVYGAIRVPVAGWIVTADN
ncbi:MAG: class I SAM-dependent methyltransferase [Stackebrandtia sp.]